MSHEDFNREEQLVTGTDRGFGLTVGGILVAIAGIRAVQAWSLDEFAWLLDEVGSVLMAVGSILVLLGLVFPRALFGLNRAWMKLGILLSRVVTPVVMGLIFFTTVMPIGLLMRLFGKDPLRIRRAPEAETYWLERTPAGPEPESMKNQF